MTTSTESSVELAINTIRTLSMDAVQKANSGHPGTPMALAPLAFTLYTRVMRHSPENPDWFNRDRFVLSAGHASMLLYSTLYLAGYGSRSTTSRTSASSNSPTAGHPEYQYHDAPGIEATTGPLGQGLAMSVGMALAERMLAARFGDDLIDHHTYVIASDGDIQEGVGSEASSLAGHLGLGKLIVFFDNNHIQLAGPTDRDFSEDVGKRYEAYGWHVQDVGEDLSVETLESATEEAKGVDDRPSLVIVRSHIGYGSPNKQDTYQAHGSPLGEDEVKATKEVYGWPPDKTFYVPDEAREPFEEAAERGREAVEEWERAAGLLPRLELRRRRRARPDHGRPAPAGWLGRGRADVRPGRRQDGHAQGVGRGDPVGGQQGAESDLRLRRPRALDADRDRGRRLRGARRLRRPQRALRRARARHGRHRQRPRPARLPRVRLHVLQLPRLHEAGGAARVADGDPGRSTCTRTTRSAWGRTAPPTSRWSSWRRCARSRTSTACGRATRTRPRSRGSSRSTQTETPTALVLSRQGLPIVSRDDIPDDADRPRRLRAPRLLERRART